MKFYFVLVLYSGQNCLCKIEIHSKTLSSFGKDVSVCFSSVLKVSSADQFYSVMAQLSVQLLNEKIIDADTLIKVRLMMEGHGMKIGDYIPIPGDLQFRRISNTDSFGVTSKIFV